jgi:hypothetical protein
LREFHDHGASLAHAGLARFEHRDPIALKLKKTKTPLSEASGCLAASALITACTSSPGLR